MDDDRAVRAEIIDSLKDNFYKPVKDSTLDESSLKGIVEGLNDRFSAYLTPKERKQFQEGVSGEFEGVGMGVDKDRRGLRVLKVFDNSPAKRAGIHEGDFITEVNGKSIARLSSSVATSRIKGPAGTPVTLQLVDPKTLKPRTLRLRRARVEVPIVEGEIKTVERQEARRGGAIRLLERSARVAAPGDPAAPRAGRSGHRARPAG